MNAKFEKLYREHRDKAAPTLGREGHFESRDEMNNYIDYRLLRDKGQSHEEASATIIAQLPQREKEAAAEARRREQWDRNNKEAVEKAISRSETTVARMGLRQHLDSK